ncbi:amino acid adenylation domain-containing protein [Flavobacteriaceae bacterium M23B6Z8]
MKESIVHNKPVISYLKEKLAGATKVAPYRSHVVSTTSSRKQTSIEISVSQELSEKLIVISKGKDINLFKLFLAGLSITLSKYTIFEKITITSSSVSLDELSFSKVSSLLLFHIAVDENDTVKELLGQIHAELTENIGQQDYDYYNSLKEFESSPEALNVCKGAGLYYEGLNNWVPELQTVSTLLKVQRNAKDLTLTLHYDASLYTADETELFGNHILRTTELLATDFSGKIKNINPITPKDESLILNSFNDTTTPYDSTPVIDQFEAQVLRNPHKIATHNGVSGLTYQELNAKANNLAHYLIEECAIQAGDTVALMVNRSENILIGILAILKAGGIFVPIDITSPEDRIYFQLNDAACKVAITETGFISQNQHQIKTLLVSVTDDCVKNDSNPGLQSGAEEVSYIVYTSGTTGRPKGALISNYSLSNNVFWFKNTFELSETDSTMLINSYNFDGCYGFLWATLITGGTLHILSDVIFDPDATLRYIKQKQITFLKMVPSTFGILVNSAVFDEDSECCNSVKMVQQGGEKINVKHLKKYLNAYPDVKLGNHYGPTECTIGAVSHWITSENIDQFTNQPVLGSPYNNQQVYILNESQELLPVGVLGEVCISGEGVSKGYLNNEALTREKFIACPFQKDQLMYKTGDKARWLPDGTIEFLGRIDNQVKIRGYRVELDEISESVKEYDTIRDAIALISKKEEQQFLSLWFTADEELTRNEVEAFLKSRLPDYMLPDHYVQIDHIPLTLNGKIDKLQLPDPFNFQLVEERELIAPKNETEVAVLELWKQLLGSSEISTNDNFFQIGGHSLKATQMLAKIHKQFEVKVPLTEVFLKPTIAELSEYLQENMQNKDFYTAIEKAPELPHYPLSHAQKRMWLTYQIQTDKTVYNIPHAIRIQADVDKYLMERSLQLLVNRHESLRTVFPIIDGEPKQKILAADASNFELDFEDLRKHSDPEKEALKIAREEASHVFDLENAPALSAKLVRVKDHEYVFLFTLHHIISDGSSTQIFTRELLQNYTALEQGDISVLPAPLDIQYKDFTFWQNREFSSDAHSRLKEYWQQKFAGELPELELPTDRNRPLVRTYEGGQQSIEFEGEIYSGLRALAKEENTTMFMVFMAFVKVLLNRYTGQQDIIVGTPVAGREHADLTDQIGFYVNTLAVRSDISPEKGFLQTLRDLKSNLLEAYEHQAYPFDQLLEDLGIRTENGRAPLFDAMVVMQDDAEEDAQQALSYDSAIEEFDSDTQTSKYDLTFSFLENNSSFSMIVEYSKELFDDAKIERLLIHFENLLDVALQNPEEAIGQINYLSLPEATLIQKFNGDFSKTGSYGSITDRFQHQVALYGDAVALVDSSLSLTYKELNDRAVKNALSLIDAGVKPGDVVGLLSHRNADFVVNMLAILKAGAVYLPLEENMPSDRINNLLEITKATSIIAENTELKSHLKENVSFLHSSDLGNKITNTTDLPQYNTDDSLAYIMFTSGTTGTPKGVMVLHKNVVRLIDNPNYTKLTPEDRILQTGSLSFDAATFEIWGALLNGGQVHIATLNELLDSNQLKQHIEQKEISKMWFTSSWFNQLADIDPSLFQNLDQVLVGGEKLSPVHIKKVKKACPDLKITNGYGPTENTTFSICGDVLDEDLDQIKLGYPISGSTVHILDKFLKPVPVGITGEIYLGGAGVSKGYINDPALTALKFIPSPFDAKDVLYKSGDLGRWNEDGRVIFYGRTDEQVKIRGHRIEPAEIQEVLLQHPSIKEVEILIIENDKQEKAVAAYFTVSEKLETAELKTFAKGRLPVYMIPEYFELLETMPLNKNGKADRKNLPMPDFSKSKTTIFEEPRSKFEEKLRDCFASVLNIKSEEISTTDSFFELGGHSLKAIGLLGIIEKEFLTRLRIANVFEAPTIQELALIVQNAEKSEAISLTKAPEDLEIYPVTPVQRRLYAIHRISPESLAYNVPGMIEVPLKHSAEAIEKACYQLVERHEILRTSFFMKDQEVFQKVHELNSFQLEIINTQDPETALEHFVKPFDLENAPLLRVGLIQTSTHNWLLMDFHHIVIDGLSQMILIEDLWDILDAKTPKEVSFQFKDYAWWLHQPSQQENLKQQESYWLERYENPLPKLELPTDYKRSALKSTSGGTAQFSISAENVKFLKKLASEQGTTLYMNLIAIWALFLSKTGAVEDVAIGTPVSGRRSNDISKIVGMFVNTLAVRLFPKATDSFVAFLQTVKKNVLADFENQDYPLEELVEKADFERGSSENPVFRTMFSLLNKEEFDLEIEEINEELRFSEKSTGVKFDLNFKVADLEDQIVCALDFSTDLFAEDTIRSFVKRFQMLLDQIRVQPEILIRTLSLVSEDEKIRLATINDTVVKFDNSDRTIDQLFDESARKYPNKSGLVDTSGILTLKQVQIASAKIANAISIEQAGVSNEFIGIMLPAQKELVLAILGIFKTGAAYIPVDTDLPSERIEHILKDSGVEILITNKEAASSINFSGKRLDIDEILTSETYGSEFTSQNRPENAAYMIYTSGSTGKPKGVPIRQYQLLNYVNWLTDTLTYSKEDSALLVSSYAYDMGHSIIFPTLIKGGTVHILKKEEYLSPVFLSEYIHDNQVSFIKMTPTLFHVFINHPDFEKQHLVSLKQLMLGGEAINAKDAAKFFSLYPEKMVLNHYGPTEATVGCIAKVITYDGWEKFEEQPVIGRPISNMKVYLLDAYLNPVPQGALGQLYLSGEGLAEGYHNREELTSEKFIENPFEEGEKMYATGDLGYWNTNYDVVFKGRVDHQIKIRGYRIELEEIASILRKLDEVKNAVVITHGEEEDKMIVAYVESTKETSKLYQELEAILPQYMIPSVIVPVTNIPMTPNGKTDMRKLKEIPFPKEELKDAQLPENEREEQLMELWESVLKVPVRDTSADFFRLGGHSLKALKIVSYIEQHWQLKVPLKVFFENPTIKTFSEKLEGLEPLAYQAIQKVTPQEHYPLSHAQQRLWLLNEVSQNQVAYNIPRVFRLKGTLDFSILRNVFNIIVERHEVLRTVFRKVEGSPRQVILAPEEIADYFIFDNYENLTTQKIQDYVSNRVNHQFDLEKGPLIKVTLLKEEKDVCLLIVNLHHIISDGWSAGILLQELCEGYNDRILGNSLEFEPLAIQYKDFAVWQNNRLSSKDHLDKQRNYWKSKLSGELNRCTLPETFARNSSVKNEGKTLTHVFRNDIANRLEKLAVEEQSSLYMLLLSALNILLYRYTGQKDILLGTVVAGRERTELSNQIGFYVNTLVQRTKLSAEDSFVEVLKRVKDDVLATTEYQNYPFDLLVSDLGLLNEEGRSPLFDIMYVHQNYDDHQDAELALEGLTVEELGEDLNESKFDVSFVSRKVKTDLQIFVEYNAALYSEEFLKEFLLNFENLLNLLIASKNDQIGEVSFMSKSSMSILEEFNATAKEKEYTSIQAHFEKSAVEQNENPAIITETCSLTYASVNEKANQMAWWIRETYGSRRNRLVAFCLERSEWQIITMLAILKSGAGFLPIDKKQPSKRKEFILKDADPVLFITDQYNEGDTILKDTKLLSDIIEKITTYPTDNPENFNEAEDLAYAIYTSGSTGVPKGVMIPHRGNINMVTDQVQRFDIHAQDRCLQFASASFDASVYEIFIGLYAGASLVLLTNAIIEDPKLFAEYLKEKKVTFATLPPVYLSGLDREALTHLKVLVTAGESPNLKDAMFLSKHLTYFNAYGPTEYSVCASVYKVRGDETMIPIGTPLENTSMHILDDNMNLLPLGCWGELYLSGIGTAIGYINREDENKKRFLANPFNETSRLYRTGDIARWNSQGFVEFKGRKDQMLKIRGYRIEIGEIEHAILKCPQIDEVVINYDKEQELLIAYLIANEHISNVELKEFLKEHLPAYMIPSFYCFLERIPLTTNGKVDYKALTSIGKNSIESRDLILPVNEKEKTIRALWAILLKKDENLISTLDNFFDYGGNSVLAMKLTSKIWEIYNEDVSIRDFLKTPTVRGLAKQIESNERDRGLLVKLNDTEHAQKNLFMIPPVLGSSSVFRNVSSYFQENEIACYGIQYRGFDYDVDFDQSIEEMASSVLNEMDVFLDNEKELFIIGYSMGALIAAEATSELEKRGYKVNLILIDKMLEDSMAEFKNADYTNHTDDAEERLLNEHMQGLDIPVHQLSRIQRLLKHNIKLIQKYRFTKHLQADLLAIEARESNIKEKMNSWKAVTDGTMIFSESSGNHFTIMNEANSYELYKNINRFINRNTN